MCLMQNVLCMQADISMVEARNLKRKCGQSKRKINVFCCLCQNELIYNFISDHLPLSSCSKLPAITYITWIILFQLFIEAV